MKFPGSKLTARDLRNGVIVLALWFGVTGLPVFFIPDSVLSDSPEAARFTSFVASYVPMIDRTAKYSQIPEVLRFYFACLWAAAPLVFVVTLVWLLPRVGRYPVPRYDPVSIFIILAFAAGIVYIAATYPVEGSPRLYRTFSSRFGLSSFGPLFVGAAALSSAGIVGWVFGLLTGRIWRRSDEIEQDAQ